MKDDPIIRVTKGATGVVISGNQRGLDRLATLILRSEWSDVWMGDRFVTEDGSELNIFVENIATARKESERSV